MIRLNNTKTTTIVSYMAVFLNALIGILFTPFIIRSLGNSQYGLYTISSSLIGFFLLDFGLGSAASRFVSKYHVIGDIENEDRAMGTIFRLYLYIDSVILIILAVVFFSISNIYKALTPSEIEQLKVIFVISAFSSVFCFPFQIFNGILTSYEKYVHIKLADIISKVFMVATITITLILNLGLYALVIVHAVAALITVAYKAFIIRKYTTAHLSVRNFDKSLVKEIVQFSLWITVMAVSHRLIFTVVPSILGIVSNTTEAAHFSVVLTIENYLYLISTAFSGMFMPTISRIYTQDNFEDNLLKLVIKVGKLIYGINIIIFIGLVFLGGDFFRLWAGPGYDEVHMGLLMVVFPSIFYNSMEVLNTAIMVKNKVKYTGLVNLCCGVVNIGLCFVTAKLWGANGACVSIMVATLARSILTYVLFHRVLNINIWIVIRDVFIKTLPVAIIAVVFGLIGNVAISGTGWISLIIRGGILVVGAVIGVLMFMRKEVLSVLKK